ncbi:MAG: DsbA family protein [Patescibacteria group bacterium]
MKNIPLLLGTIAGTLLLIMGVAFFFSQEAPEQASVDPSVVTQDARHTYGPDNAAVTVVKFSDFQCPSCRAAAPLVTDLKERYPEDVQVVYRHFPLDSFANSRLAATASEVAAESGLFWEYHDLLFDNQQTWSAISGRGEVLEEFAGYAEQLEIDKAIFLERMEDSELMQNVETDRQVGEALQVTATPTFFVNGERISAPQLLAAVESALATSDTTSEDSVLESEDVESATDSAEAE